MLSSLRIALVCILVLIVPLGGTPFECERPVEGCESWCPCDEHDETHDETPPCDEDCGEDCSGCCEARVAVALVGRVGLPSMSLGAVATCELPPLDAPGRRLAIGVFRPPRSLT
jgi:hypothetical protein